ncbi:MAG: DUF5908 family protein [Caldilineaceae bacterium]
MPIEIKELVIRAVVITQDAEAEAIPSTPASPDEKEALIQECVRQVLRILKQMKER